MRMSRVVSPVSAADAAGTEAAGTDRGAAFGEIAEAGVGAGFRFPGSAPGVWALDGMLLPCGAMIGEMPTVRKRRKGNAR